MSAKQGAVRVATDEENEDGAALLLDGFEKALIGYGTQFAHDVAIYDYERCAAILIKQGMSREDAVEYLEFNTAGAWVGRHTPILLRERVRAPK